MELSPHLQRACVLREQGRNELAEKELRQHLVGDPDDAFAQALLSTVLSDLERFDEAEESARQAITLDPELAYAHYALANVYFDRRRPEQAKTVIEEAIRLEPEDADYHAFLASVHMNRESWTEALAAAEAGLEFNPEHVGANNLRAMALVKLGRKAEAGATIDNTLARNPDNAVSHANMGWTLLEQGRRKEAMHAFRESLRLDPTQSWARAGLLESIKAGNPVYAVVLNYFLWMNKLPEQTRWAIIIGGYFGIRMLRGLGAGNPTLNLFVTPLWILYIVFAVLTWLAAPIFNLMLFLHPLGRHVLDDEQRVQARLVGSSLGLALAFCVAWIAGFDSVFSRTGALVFGILSIPLAAVFMCQPGWPRRAMTVITGVLALMGVAAVGLSMPGSGMANVSDNGVFLGYCFAVFISQWVANFLSSRTPER